MRQSLPSGRHSAAASGRLQSCRQTVVARVHTTSMPQHSTRIDGPDVRSASSGGSDACPSSSTSGANAPTSSPEAVSYAIRGTTCSDAGPCTTNPAWSATRTAWRATLAAAASACVLQGSFAPLTWPSLDPHSNPSALDPVVFSTRGPFRSAFLAAAGPPPALAAEGPRGHAGTSAAATAGGGSGGEHDKMERLRELATPDVAAMREISEELVAGGASRALTEAASAARGRSQGAESKGAAAAARFDPKARPKAADLASLLHISPATAKELLASERQLGRTTLGSLASSFDTVREILGLGDSGLATVRGGDRAASEELSQRRAEAAGAVVSRQPRVLLVGPEELRERFGELQTLLSVPAPLARSLAASQPALLATPPLELRGRLSGLCRLFNVDPPLAASLGARAPGLLVVGEGELAGRAARLGEQLRLSKPQLVALIRRQPRALLLPPAALSARLTALARLLHIKPQPAPAQLLPQPQGAKGGKTSSSSSGGDVGWALGGVVLHAPSLLQLESGEVERRLGELAQLLGLTEEAAAAAAGAHPALLAAAPPVLAGRLETVAELAGVPMAQARAMVAERPALLTKTSTAMREAVAEAEAAEVKAAEEAGANAKAGGASVSRRQ